MAVEYKGTQAFVTYTDYEYDPEDGLYLTYREKGIPAIIEGRANAWANAGWDVFTNRRGPWMELLARRNRFIQSHPYTERWNVAKRMLEKSIWSLPAVIEEMGSFSLGAADYRAGIEKALREGTDLSDAYDEPSWAVYLLYELRRGVEAYETEYTTLQRDISFDFEHPVVTLSLTSSRLIYTTAQLVANENIPGDVLFDLPSDPATPDDDTNNTRWGWRVTSQDADITNGTTGSHRTEWTYAQWSTFLYEKAS